MILVVADLPAQNHWEPIYQSDFRFWNIAFATPEIGWAGSAPWWPPLPALYGTTDGGFSWTIVLDSQFPEMMFGSMDVAVFDQRHGYVASSGHGAVTLDGALWQVIDLPTGFDVTDVVYLDSTTLIGTSDGHYGPRQISRSTDGGLTWIMLYSDYIDPDAAQALLFKPVWSSNGTLLVYAYYDTVGFTLASFWRSTDRGDTWQAGPDLPEPLQHVYDYAAADSGVFFCTSVSENGTQIWRSTDDGITWEEVWTEVENAFYPYVIAFSDPLHGWMTGEKHMVQTTDGGESWAEYMLPDSMWWGFASMCFLDSTLGWAVVPGNLSVGAEVYRWSTSQGAGGEWNGLLPTQIEIVNCYPNPFNNVVKISLSLPRESNVNATIYDILGRPVDALLHTVLSAGTHQLAWEGSHHVSGTYVLRIEDGQNSVTKKLLLVR